MSWECRPALCGPCFLALAALASSAVGIQSPGYCFPRKKHIIFQKWRLEFDFEGFVGEWKLDQGVSKVLRKEKFNSKAALLGNVGGGHLAAVPEERGRGRGANSCQTSPS